MAGDPISFSGREKEKGLHKRADEGIGPYNHDRKCGTRSKKRADRVVRPYMVRRKIGGTGGQSRPPLQIPLRRRYKPCAQIVTLVTAPLTAVLFQTFSAILAILTDLRQRRKLDVFHIHTPFL